MQIRTTSADEILSAPEFRALCDAYAEESGNPEFGPYQVAQQAYPALEKAGSLLCAGVWHDATLVGFGAVTLNRLPHFQDCMVASIDAIFVRADSRKGGAGVRLLRHLERMAREAGAGAIMATTPIEGRFRAVLGRTGYRESDVICIKGL